MKYLTISEEVDAIQFKNLNIEEVKSFLNCEILQLNVANNTYQLIISVDGVNVSVRDGNYLVVDKYNNLNIYNEVDFHKKFVIKGE